VYTMNTNDSQEEITENIPINSDANELPKIEKIEKICKTTINTNDGDLHVNDIQPDPDPEAVTETTQTEESLNEDDWYYNSGDIPPCNNTTNNRTTGLILEVAERISKKCDVHFNNEVEKDIDVKIVAESLQKTPAGIKIPGVNDKPKPIYDLKIGDVVDTMTITNPRKPHNAISCTKIFYEVTIVDVTDKELFIIANRVASIYNNSSQYEKYRNKINKNKESVGDRLKCIDELNIIIDNSIQICKISTMYFDIVNNIKPTKTYKDFFKK
jgi:hypothetical protein